MNSYEGAEPDLRFSPLSVLYKVIDMTLDRLYQSLPCRIFSAMIHLPLHGSLKAFYGSTINASADPRHALGHSGIHNLLPESFRGIPVSPVRMKDWFRVRIRCNRFIKGLKYDLVIIMVTIFKCHWSVAAQIKYETR